MSKRPTNPAGPRDEHDTTDGAASGLSFEQAMAQLEDIVRKVESGEVGLEASMEQYERGVALVKQCQGILARAEQRVVELSVQMDGAGKRPVDS